MGYAMTTFLVFGVNLTSEDAAKVYEDCLEDLETKGTIFYYKEDVEVEVVTSPNPRYKDYEKHRYYPDMFSKDSDSRIHNQKYDEDFDHVVGLKVAATGYACDDDIASYMTPNKMCTDNFNKYIKPMLEALEITAEEPKMIIFNQMK